LKTYWSKNNKDSILVWVLFFVFCPFVLQASYIMSADTLILDGELIRIEKREVVVDLDSLKEKLYEDIQEPRVKKIFSLAVELGGTLGSVKQTTSIDTMQTLAQFLGDNNQFQVQPMGRLSAAVYLQPRIGLLLNVGVERYSCTVPTLTPNDLEADSSIFRFENRNGQLWQYFVYPIGIGFETDTTQVEISSSKRALWLLNAQVAGRFFLSKANAINHTPRVKVFADIGIQLSWTVRNRYADFGNQQAVLVNTSGRSLLQNNEVFETKATYVRSLVGIGSMVALTDQWHLQFSASASFPPFFFTRERDYSISFSGVQLGMGITRFF
jgi:hypothetical protein